MGWLFEMSLSQQSIRADTVGRMENDRNHRPDLGGGQNSASSNVPGSGGGLGLLAIVLGLFVVVTMGLLLKTLLVPAGAPAKSTISTGDYSALTAIVDSAAAYLDQAQAGKAEAILREALGKYPEDQDLHLLLGQALINQRRLDEAYGEYIAALAIGPRDADIEFSAGTLANQIGQPERALEHYAAAQTADPSHPDYPLYRGQVQFKLGRYSEGRASLVMAARLKPDRAIIWGTLADLELLENNARVALQHIARARDLEPENGMWRVIEAKAFKRQGKAAKALTLLLGLDASQRQDTNVRRLTAECFGMMNRPVDGARVYVEAFDERQPDADLAFEAAVWFDRAGDGSNALEWAKRAAQLGHQQADKLVARLAQAEDGG